MSKICRRRFMRNSAGAFLAFMSPSLLGSGCNDGGTDSVTDVTPDQTTDLNGSVEDLVRRDVAEEIIPRSGSSIHASLGTAVQDFYDMGMDAAKNVGITGNNLTGATVFIKPNFVTLGLEIFGCQFDPSVGECTKPELVAAVAQQCLDAGAAKVIIGEGAQKESWDWSGLTFNVGNDAGGATNLKDAAEWLNTRYGAGKVETLCLNQENDWLALPSASQHENMKDGLFVARSMMEADHIISLPVMKTHTFAMMTASMKNYFGAVASDIHGNGLSRCWAHLAYKDTTAYGVENCGVSGAFIDIHKWRKEEGYADFAIMDATICLEGTGPHTAPVNDGITIHTKLRNDAGAYAVLSSTDLVAVDATAMRIMGLNEADIPALRMARNLELGVLDDVHLQGASLDELLIKDWQKPVIEGESYFEPICK